MSADTRGDAALAARIDRRLAALGDALPGELGRAYAGFRDRVGVDAGYFLDPRALPVAQLPLWALSLAERVGSPLPAGADQRLLDAALAGYLHVRVVDDRIDEGLGDEASSTLLAGALGALHHAALAEVVGDDPRFWQLARRCWSGFGDAMLLERTLHDRGGVEDEASYHAILRRSSPLQLPHAAALCAAGLHDRLEGLAGHVDALVDAHQRFHDLMDAERDLAAGNRTWVLTRLDGDGSVAGVRRAMLLEGGIDTLVDEAHERLSAAGDAARAIGLDEALAEVDARRATMDDLRRDAFRRLFAEILDR